jgi:hypothetical protein
VLVEDALGREAMRASGVAVVEGGEASPAPALADIAVAPVSEPRYSSPDPYRRPLSGTIRDVLLGSEFKFEDRGRHTLKGIEGEWPLFAVSD